MARARDVRTMKKFDWFTNLVTLGLFLNAICFILQGGWLAVFGVIFGSFWLCIAYWDWKNKQKAKILDTASRSQATDIQMMCDAFHRIGRSGVTADEFADALNNACSSPHFIGDTTCKYNARSPNPK